MSSELGITMMDALGADGNILLGAFMNGFTDERGPVIGFSRDGETITLLNDGEPVFIIPGYQPFLNVARDYTFMFQPEIHRFSVGFTAGNYGHSGYFSILASNSLKHGTWAKVTDVRMDHITGGTGIIWGPDLVPYAGNVLGFVAASNGTPQSPGALRLQRIKFHDPYDLAAGYDDAVPVVVPAGGRAAETSGVGFDGSPAVPDASVAGGTIDFSVTSAADTSESTLRAPSTRRSTVPGS